MERMKQLVIDTALTIRRDARASFYTYHDGPPKALRHDGVWRSGPNRQGREPRKEFVAGNEAGDYKISIISRRSPVLVRDAEVEGIPGWTSALDYKTSISAPVANDQTVFGLLCIDAPQSGDLTEEDRRTMTSLAQILTAALTVTQTAADPGSS
jgi:GAF domain-containing protein